MSLRTKKALLKGDFRFKCAFLPCIETAGLAGVDAGIANQYVDMLVTLSVLSGKPNHSANDLAFCNIADELP